MTDNRVLDIDTATKVTRQIRRLFRQHGETHGQRCYSTRRKTSRTVKWYACKPEVVRAMAVILDRQGIPYHTQHTFANRPAESGRCTYKDLIIHTDLAFNVRSVPVEPLTKADKIIARKSKLEQQFAVREYLKVLGEYERLTPYELAEGNEPIFAPPAPAEVTAGEQAIAERVNRQIVLCLGIEPEQIKLDSNIFDDLGADSLDAVELSMRIEEEFDVEIPDDEAERILTPQQMVQFLMRVLTVTEVVTAARKHAARR